MPGLAQQHPVCVCTGHRDQVLCVAWHESSLMFASGAHDGVVMVWRTDLHVPIHVLRGHEGIVYSCVYLPESNRCAIWGLEEQVLPRARLL
jgi:WD40 repeat protein